MNRVTQGSLLKIAAIFLILQTLIITLSPAVRERSVNVDYRWSQWIALGIWGLFALRAHHDIVKFFPDADPYLFPAAALLSGWGLLTIWRLDPGFGSRQALWLGVSIFVLLYGLRLPNILVLLRKYKYLLLTGGLILTGLTLFFGTNPLGFGPRLWLGCCGVYFQPSEPLKLLLVAYLAAYLADRIPIKLRTFPLLYPTLLLSGLAILLLLVQRDLGTASIFITLYMIMIYLATGRRRTVVVSVVLLVLVSVAGYYLVDIIQSRFNSWLYPWDDTSGGSYQIVQSLLAIANGGVEGRGPGLGSPGLVPVAISDFIFSAIAEETGLLGTVGLLGIFGLILARGLRISLRAPDLFRRLLAAGLTTYIGIQALLIIGGNIRFLPLTGVTLPFVSYGGSSLLTSFIALFFLLIISNHLDEEPEPLPRPQPYLALSAVLSLGLLTVALINGWWAIVRGPDLLTRNDNPRRVIEDRYVPRGSLLDRSNVVINTNDGKAGSYTRVYKYPDLAPIVGYNHPVYGQAGLEAVLDDYLRGEKGNPAATILWNHLVYGMAPSGLDVRLSIDLYLQYRADDMMITEKGAVLLMNAQSGEILVMSSRPTFNPNYMNEIGPRLTKDPDKPLINRATLGLYPTGTLVDPFARSIFGKKNLDNNELNDVFEAFGFFRTPEIQIQTAEPLTNSELENPHVTPLQVALASAALSNHGMIPAPRIATAVNTPSEGWVVLPALGTPFEALQPSAADDAAKSLLVEGQSYWAYVGKANENNSTVTWFIAGTPPNWQASPLVVVVLLEGDDSRMARRIGQELLVDAMNP